MKERGPSQRWRRSSKLEKIFMIICLGSTTTVFFIIWSSAAGVPSDNCNMLNQRNLELETQIRNLQRRIKDLETEVEKCKKPQSKLSNLLSSREVSLTDQQENDLQFYKRKVNDSHNDIRFLMDEYDVIQYASFNKKYIYVVNSGTYGRVLERLEGVKKKDIQEVIMFATSKIYESRKNISDKFVFSNGIFRTDPGIGTRYEVFFRPMDSLESEVHKVSVFRPFGPLYLIDRSRANAQQDLIHMIMPLAGRTTMLEMFLANFAHTVIEPKENVILTIAYAGTEGLDETKALIEKTIKETGFSGINLIELRGRFSRGRALQTAVLRIMDNALVFFVDVDVIYQRSFLQRCRLNAKSGEKVFYPIIFSLYNPDVVYTLQNIRKPRIREQYVITSETGFWRDFGYGMTCQYRDDFLRMGGFKKDIVGWGMEDVLLFRKYSQSNISIVRSVDHGLFHTWHEKTCDQSLSWNQFKACIGSKARSEASHGLLGMMAFSVEVSSYRERHGMMHHTLRPRAN